MDGDAPAGSGEVAVDSATAAAAGVKTGDRVRVVANGRPATGYRVSAVVDAPGTGVLLRRPDGRTAVGPRRRSARPDCRPDRSAHRAGGRGTGRRRRPYTAEGHRASGGHRCGPRGPRVARRGCEPLPADPARRVPLRDHRADHRVRHGERAGRVARRAAPRPGADAGRRRDSPADHGDLPPSQATVIAAVALVPAVARRLSPGRRVPRPTGGPGRHPCRTPPHLQSVARGRDDPPDGPRRAALGTGCGMAHLPHAGDRGGRRVAQRTPQPVQNPYALRSRGRPRRDRPVGPPALLPHRPRRHRHVHRGHHRRDRSGTGRAGPRPGRRRRREPAHPFRHLRADLAGDVQRPRLRPAQRGDRQHPGHGGRVRADVHLRPDHRDGRHHPGHPRRHPRPAAPERAGPGRTARGHPRRRTQDARGPGGGPGRHHDGDLVLQDARRHGVRGRLRDDPHPGLRGRPRPRRTGRRHRPSHRRHRRRQRRRRPLALGGRGPTGAAGPRRRRTRRRQGRRRLRPRSRLRLGRPLPRPGGRTHHDGARPVRPRAAPTARPRPRRTSPPWPRPAPA